MVDLKQKELGDVNRAFAEQKHALEDLNERLSASMQSCAEANALINRYDLFNAFPIHNQLLDLDFLLKTNFQNYFWGVFPIFSN